jgi:hypothetical protein
MFVRFWVIWRAGVAAPLARALSPSDLRVDTGGDAALRPMPPLRRRVHHRALKTCPCTVHVASGAAAARRVVVARRALARANFRGHSLGWEVQSLQGSYKTNLRAAYRRDPATCCRATRTCRCTHVCRCVFCIRIRQRKETAPRAAVPNNVLFRPAITLPVIASNWRQTDSKWCLGDRLTPSGIQICIQTGLKLHRGGVAAPNWMQACVQSVPVCLLVGLKMHPTHMHAK